MATKKKPISKTVKKEIIDEIKPISVIEEIDVEYKNEQEETIIEKPLDSEIEEEINQILEYNDNQEPNQQNEHPKTPIFKRDSEGRFYVDAYED